MKMRKADQEQLDKDIDYFWGIWWDSFKYKLCLGFLISVPIVQIVILFLVVWEFLK